MALDVTSAGDSDSLGSLADEELDNNDDDNENDALQDNWIEELECALLAECDPATLKKICEGKKIPDNLRYDYWRTLLALDGTEKVKLVTDYDLPNQDELRRDCELLVEDISTTIAQAPLTEEDKVRLKADFESTLTTYVKARPELEYVSGNGWTDILKVLYNLKLSGIQIYQVFFRIVDRYIPKNLSPTKRKIIIQQSFDDDNNSHPAKLPVIPSGKNKISASNQQQLKPVNVQSNFSREDLERSVQAYHLLRLLIQYHDPELCSILDSRKVTPNLYVKDWFCSLFARSCPTKLALHIWDTHFKMADPFLIFFAAIVMVVNASEELKKKNLSQEDMLKILKVMPSKLEEDDIEDLYYLVSNHYTYSTPRSMRSYSHLFFMDTFANTYSGNDSPERDGSPTFVDAKTARLTSSIDLSQYLCLPIVPAEIFNFDTVKNHRKQSSSNSSPDSSESNSPSPSALNLPLKYFLVDCRPAEQYNAGHLNKAFHLDCSLMLREPSSFATAVQALLEIQRQVVASKSNTGGQHLCFIGSGQEEEDRYVNMVVASFLQRYQKYVSIVYGGFEAIHDYVKTKSKLSDSFDEYIVDHNAELCKACCSGSSEAMERLRLKVETENAKLSSQQQTGGLGSSLLATTTSFFKGDKTTAHAALTKFAASNPQATATANMLAQSGASMLDRFATAFVSKSNVLKDRLVETINNNAIPNSAYAAARSHVSSQDKGPRYLGNSGHVDESRRRMVSEGDAAKSRLDDAAAGLLTVTADSIHGQHAQLIDEEPCQEVQIDTWRAENNITAIYQCSQIKGTNKYPGYIALTKTHLWILREIPHNKGFASIAAKRPLNMLVQITSKRKQSDFIIFRYGYAQNSNRIPQDSSSPRSDQGEEAKQSSPSDNSNKEKILPKIIASDNLHIPQPFEVIRLVKREVVRIMDEASRKDLVAEKPKDTDATDKPDTTSHPNDNQQNVNEENNESKTDTDGTPRSESQVEQPVELSAIEKSDHPNPEEGKSDETSC